MLTTPVTGVVPSITVNDVVVKVAVFMFSLKVAVTSAFSCTSVAWCWGTVETTVGAGAAGAMVVNVHTWLAARGTPAALVAPVVIVAVYRVPSSRSTAGLY